MRVAASTGIATGGGGKEPFVAVDDNGNSMILAVGGFALRAETGFTEAAVGANDAGRGGTVRGD